MDWNVIATVAQGPGHERRLLQGLKRLGEFHASHFKDVCLGRVADAPAFLEAVREALAAGEGWTRHLARIVPVERTFRFEPEDFAARLKEALAPMAPRLGGTFFVRVERRGLLGRVHSQEAERDAADCLIALVQGRGGSLQTDFADPDWIVACETLGGEAGVALLDRALRRRYPFVRVR